MKFTKDGNLSPWLRVLLAFGGLFIMYLSYQFLIGIWMYLGLMTGLVTGSIGAYAEQANTLKLKPFDKTYNTARDSYKKDDGKSE